MYYLLRQHFENYSRVSNNYIYIINVNCIVEQHLNIFINYIRALFKLVAKYVSEIHSSLIIFLCQLF